MDKPMDKTEAELIQFKRQAIESEVAHRRDKLWRIFSWAGSLLVALTGGFIALRANQQSQFNPSRFQRGMLIFAVTVLTVHASLWLTQNLQLEDDAQEDLDKYDEMLDIEHTKSERSRFLQFVRRRFGYRPAVILLAVAAILTILLA
jgi:hypothetical protein